VFGKASLPASQSCFQLFLLNASERNSFSLKAFFSSPYMHGSLGKSEVSLKILASPSFLYAIFPKKVVLPNVYENGFSSTSKAIFTVN
jgi:hypothetical protein